MSHTMREPSLKAERINPFPTETMGGQSCRERI